jgi:Mrp family chromosome partitioning ATPase
VSKYFELMQEMERKQPSSFASTPASVHSAPDERTDYSSHNRLAYDEALQLVQQIFFLKTDDPPRVVVFASIDPGNGCSQICAAVAQTLAKESRRPVCLTEANFRSPGLPEVFGTTKHHGLADALRQSDPITSFMRPITSGDLTVDSPSSLNLEHFRERLDELRAEFEFVIIDAPPLAQYSDAVVLGQYCDGLVLILEADSTRRDKASTVAATLRSANVPLLAAVLNKTSLPIP